MMLDSPIAHNAPSPAALCAICFLVLQTLTLFRQKRRIVMSPLAAALMSSRIEHSMSRYRAAECAGVSERTWRSYEQGQRRPRRSVVQNFYDRSGIPMPSDTARLLRVTQTARVISITSLKGGVGKSPITIDVAACLVERGNRVAVITHDCCYEDGVSNGARPLTGSLAERID